MDKLDSHVAAMYAVRCSKPQADLLALMKTGGWLTASEAKEWGFVDDVTDYAEDIKPMMTHRTDGTDAFDTLYIGCEKFFKHETAKPSAPSTTSIASQLEGFYRRFGAVLMRFRTLLHQKFSFYLKIEQK